MPTQTDNEAKRAGKSGSNSGLVTAGIVVAMALIGMGVVSHKAASVINEVNEEVRQAGIVEGRRQMSDAMFAELAVKCPEGGETITDECKLAGATIVGGMIRVYFPTVRPVAK